jgi:hypothetical protein
VTCTWSESDDDIDVEDELNPTPPFFILYLAPGSVLYTHTPQSKYSFIILDQTPFFPLTSPPEMHLCHCQRAQLPIGYLSTVVQLLRSSPSLLFAFLGHVVRSSSGISFLLRKMSRFWQRSHALLRGNVTDLVPHSGFFAQNIADFRPDFRPFVAQP